MGEALMGRVYNGGGGSFGVKSMRYPVAMILSSCMFSIILYTQTLKSLVSCKEEI